MKMDLLTFNHRGGRVTRQKVEWMNAWREMWDNASMFHYIAGFTLDGFGIVTVVRDTNGTVVSLRSIDTMSNEPKFKDMTEADVQNALLKYA